MARGLDFLTVVSGALGEVSRVFLKGARGCRGDGSVLSSCDFFNSMANLNALPHVPPFDGKASASAIYEEKVIIRNQIPPIGSGGRGADSFSRTTDIARKVCVTISKHHIASGDGVRYILRILRGRSAPDVIDATYQEVVKFMSFRLAGLTMDVFLMEFGAWREKPGVRMAMRNGFLDEFGPIFCAQNAEWRFQRLRTMCADSSARVATQCGTTFYRRPIWIRCPMGEYFTAWVAYSKAKREKTEENNSEDRGKRGG